MLAPLTRPILINYMPLYDFTLLLIVVIVVACGIVGKCMDNRLGGVGWGGWKVGDFGGGKMLESEVLHFFGGFLLGVLHILGVLHRDLMEICTGFCLLYPQFLVII